MAARESGEPSDFDAADPFDVAEQKAMQSLATSNDVAARSAIDAGRPVKMPDGTIAPGPRFMTMPDGRRVLADKLNPDTLNHPAFAAEQEAWLSEMAKIHAGTPTPTFAEQDAAWLKEHGHQGAPPPAAPPPGQPQPAPAAPAQQVQPARQVQPAPVAAPQPGGAPQSNTLGGTFTDIARFEREQKEQQKRSDAARDAELDAQKKAIDAQADVDTRLSDAKATLLQNEQNNQDRLAATAADNAATRKKAVDDARATVAQLSEQQAATAFDPDRFMKRQGTGGQIGSAIAIALGGFGAALSHSGSNAALSIIENAINRDIDGQKEDYNRGERRLSDARNNDLHDLIARGLSDEQAEATLRAAAWTRAQRQIDVTGASFGGDQANARKLALTAAAQGKATEQTDLAGQHALSNAERLIVLKNQAREFALKQSELEAAAAMKGQGAGGRVPNEQAEKMDSNINGMKALLGAAGKFHEATNDIVPLGNVLGQLSGAGATSQYQRLRETSAGAVAGVQDPAAKMQPGLIERAEHSLPDARYDSHSKGMSNYASQYKMGRDYLLTRIETERGQGRDVSAYQKLLDEMDAQAQELGIFGIKTTPVPGGR